MNTNTITGSIATDNIDNAIADLEVANAMLSAAEAFMSSLRTLFVPGGALGNSSVLKECNDAQIMIAEGAIRISLASNRLENAMGEFNKSSKVVA